MAPCRACMCKCVPEVPGYGHGICTTVNPAGDRGQLSWFQSSRDRGRGAPPTQQQQQQQQYSQSNATAVDTSIFELDLGLLLCPSIAASSYNRGLVPGTRSHVYTCGTDDRCTAAVCLMRCVQSAWELIPGTRHQVPGGTRHQARTRYG